jgi:hypothetical protein
MALDRITPTTVLCKKPANFKFKALKEGLDAFLTRANDGENKAAVLVLSRRSKPHLVFRYMASVLGDKALFAHLHVDSLARDVDGSQLRKVLGAAVADIWLARDAGNKKPMAVVYRGAQADPLVLYEELSNDHAELLDTLEPLVTKRVPRLHRDNFYELCFKKGDTTCVVCLAERELDVRVTSLHQGSLDALQGHVQLAWLPASANKRFVSFFQSKHQRSTSMTCIAMQANKGQFAVFDKSMSASAGGDAFVEFVEGVTVGDVKTMSLKGKAIPFPQKHKFKSATSGGFLDSFLGSLFSVGEAGTADGEGSFFYVSVVIMVGFFFVASALL